MNVNDDELIQFLNGFNVNSVSDVYLNADGNPTDTFLEALKSDDIESIALNVPKQNTSREQYLHSNQTIRHTQQATSSSVTTFMPNKTNINSDDSFASDFDEIMFENPQNTEKYRLFKQQRMEGTDSDIFGTKNKKKITRKSIYDEDRENKTFQNEKIKRKKAAKPPVRRTTAEKPSPAVHVTDKPNSRVNAKASAAAEVQYPSVHSVFDTTELEVESEARVRALRLRIQGQLNTIRSLEAQIAEQGEVVVARNKQLAHAHARLKVLEPAVARANRSGSAEGRDGRECAQCRAAAEVADKIRKQGVSTQSRLQEEQLRRQRAEEKARVLRDYAEKAKTRCQRLEGENAELRAAAVEKEARAEKYRKAYKDMAAELAAQKAAVGDKDIELMDQRLKTEKTAVALRNVQLELDHCRAELRTARSSGKGAEVKARQLEVQLDIVREKEATRRAERRLASLEASRRDHTSRGRSQSADRGGRMESSVGAKGLGHSQATTRIRQQRNDSLSSRYARVASASPYRSRDAQWNDSPKPRGSLEPPPSSSSSSSLQSVPLDPYHPYRLRDSSREYSVPLSVAAAYNDVCEDDDAALYRDPFSGIGTNSDRQSVLPPQWVRSRESVTGFEHQMAFAENELDRAVVSENDSLLRRSLGAESTHGAACCSDAQPLAQTRNGFVPSTGSDSAPRTVSSAVSFIRNRAGTPDSSLLRSTSHESAAADRFKLPQQERRPQVPPRPPQTSDQRSSGGISMRGVAVEAHQTPEPPQQQQNVGDTLSVTSTDSNRGGGSRLQKLYAKVTAKSLASSNSSAAPVH